MDLTGIHHLTAVSATIRDNYRFYTQTLGMRLVKRSVNQDDVSAYHLFYADAVGSPGTDLTFFDWKMPRERRGTQSLVRTHLRVAGPASLEWWAGPFRSSASPRPALWNATGGLPSTSRTPRASGSRSSMTAVGATGRSPGTRARCRRPIRYAGSARS